jgi:integrase
MFLWYSGIGGNLLVWFVYPNPLCHNWAGYRHFNFHGYWDILKVRRYDISFHSLRHSHATILIQYYRKSINAVSKRLGHSNEVTTLTIYASILPQEDGDIAETMGEMMKSI